MIKAQIIERYIRTNVNGGARRRLDEIIHETRYFSTKEKFHEWLDTFKGELWEDDPQKVKLVEGIYVETEEIELDNLEKPRRLRLYASFRNGVSYKYAS